MDDTYIHLQYARNLAATGRLELNPGEFRGLGTTSLLWVLLLTGGIKLGIAGEIGMRVLGIASLLVATLCVYWLARSWFGEAQRAQPGALLVAVLFALSGNIIWFTLSGMETMLFLALGLLTLVCYGHGLWWAVGVLIGLVGVTRPEGLALAPTLGLLELLRLRAGGRSQWRGWMAAAVLAAIPIGAWLLYCHGTTGHWLPTTFSGKRTAQLDAVQHFLDAVPMIGLGTRSPQVVWLLVWIGYAFLYVFGVVALPGPALTITRELGATVSLRLSVVGLALGVLVVVPLLVLGTRQAWRFAKGAVGHADALSLAGLGVWVWALVHNAAYFVLLPIAGTATRYQAINHLLLWSLIALGLFALSARRWLRSLYGAAVLVLVLTDLGYWRGVYGANLTHMRQARIAAAEYLAQELPPEARVAAYDIGALRYFGQRTIVDLGGLTDVGFAEYQREHRVDQYLKDRSATHLALPARHSTDRAALFDFAEYLGIARSPLYELQELAVFETDHALWQRGNDATANYQPSVRLYCIDWRRR